jgi:SAM-dependent methyltransferase
MRSPLWFLSKFNLDPPSTWGISSDVHLDAGCGNSPRNPFNARRLLGMDIVEDGFITSKVDFEYLKINVDGKIPLENDSVDSISGFDFIEHLPRGSSLEPNLFIQFMNESCRVLKKDGTLLLVTPAFPSPAAFQDPTHVNYITEKTIEYFTGSSSIAFELGYGFEGKFRLVYQGWVSPLSCIWENSPDPITENLQVRKIKRLIFSFSTFKRLRSFVSGLRNPTHLLWVIKKTD